MTNFHKISAAIFLTFCANSAHAYGSNHGSGGCDKPVFTEFKPAVNKYLQSFSEFSLLASSNTAPTSINITISVGENKYHFTPKELVITPRKTGSLEVKGKIDRPVEHGFARLSVTAHSKPGCEHTDGILIRIH